MAGAPQDATILGAQRNYVPGPGEIIGNTARISQQPHCRSPVGSRNPGSYTIFRVNGNGVGGAVLVLIDRVHGQQAQPVADRTG